MTSVEFIELFVEKYRTTLVCCYMHGFDQYHIEFHALTATNRLDPIWYQFVNHRWIQISNAHAANMISNYASQFEQAQIYTMQTHICRALLDTNFVNCLNMNHDRICFSNGVYDVSNCTFRDGVPHDYSTLSTGYDYVEYNPDSDIAKEIDRYIEAMFPENKLVFLQKMAKIMTTDVQHRSDIIYGAGKSGKTVLRMLISKMLGEYSVLVQRSMPSKHIMHIHNDIVANDSVEYIKNIAAASDANSSYCRRQRCSNLVIVDSDELPDIANDTKYVRQIIHLAQQFHHGVRIDVERIAPMFMDLILKCIDDTKIAASTANKKSARF